MGIDFIHDAPHKELIWFENSAHLSYIEEPERCQDVIIERALPATGGPSEAKQD